MIVLRITGSFSDYSSLNLGRVSDEFEKTENLPEISLSLPQPHDRRGATYFALKTFFIHVIVDTDQMSRCFVLTEFSLRTYPKSQIFPICHAAMYIYFSLYAKTKVLKSYK